MGKTFLLVVATIFSSLIAVMLVGHHYYELERGIDFINRHSIEVVVIMAKMSIVVGLITYAADCFRKGFFQQKSTNEATINRD